MKGKHVCLQVRVGRWQQALDALGGSFRALRTGHHDAVIPVPLATVVEASRTWDKVAPLVLVCGSGEGSRVAACL